MHRIARALVAPGWRGFLALLVLTLVTHNAALFMPLLSNDEATYSSLAARILAGHAPYSGAVDHKPAGIMLLYAAVFLLTKRNCLFAVRILCLVAITATGWLLGQVAERLYDEERMRWAGPLYIVASMCGLPSDLQAANTELFLNLPLCAAALCVTRSGRGDWLRAGLLTGLAGVLKYQAAVAGVAWALVALFSPQRFRRWAQLLVGFGVAAYAYLRVVAMFGWDDFVFWGWKYNYRYIGAQTTAAAVRAALLNGAFMALWWSLLLVALRRGAPRAAWAWLAASLLMVTPGGRYFPHYFLMLLPALVVLATPGVLALAQRRAYQAACALVVVVATGISWGWYSIRPDLDRHYLVYRKASAYLAAHSAPDEPAFVWGNAPVYFYADRVMATRFAFCNYVTGKVWGTRYNDKDQDTSSQVVPEAWTFLMTDLERARPRYIVDTAAARVDGYGNHPLLGDPRMRDFVTAHYTQEATVEGAVFWRRRVDR